MKSLAVRLRDALARRIEAESLARRVSKSDIARERLDQPARETPVTEGMRQILEEGWAAKVPEQPVRFGSPKKQRLSKLLTDRKNNLH